MEVYVVVVVESAQVLGIYPTLEAAIEKCRESEPNGMADGWLDGYYTAYMYTKGGAECLNIQKHILQF